MAKRVALSAAIALLWGLGGASPSRAGQSSATVRITPLGSHAGELCFHDRALLFEDPTGVRILFDPGRTVNGGDDPRLGDVHVVLLTHAHADHLGERYFGAAGTCAAPAAGPVFPQSNLAAIAAARNSAVLAPGELPPFLGQKIQNLRNGMATPACPEAGIANELTVPRSQPCTAPLRQGGSRLVRLEGSSGGVQVAVVAAVHTNGIPSALLDAPGVAAGTTGNAGDAAGFVLKFSNGLSVYLSGDTGMFGDMEAVIRRYYAPSVAVLVIGDVFSMGPDEAAFAARSFLGVRSVLPWHAREASTSGGSPREGSRVARFASQLGGGSSVVLPLSDVAREFDGQGNCVNCR